MDLITLAAARNYTNEQTGAGSYELIDKIMISEDVQNIRRIELVPDEDSPGNAVIRIYGVTEQTEGEEK